MFRRFAERGSAVVLLAMFSVACSNAATRSLPGAGAQSPHVAALVLYDTNGQWGGLGELYAMAAANLAGHFGSVVTEPIASYTSRRIDAFTATIYIGSTYYSGSDPVPAVFYRDVASSSRPVIWVNDNIWNFANSIGRDAFVTKYGWDPIDSHFAPGGTVGNITQVTYKGQPLARSIPAGHDGGVLHPHLSAGSSPAVTTLAEAVDTSTSPATTFPWALRSGNLTYIGEIPFEYAIEGDRLIAFEDLLFEALAPNTPTRHRALVRLEDLSPHDNPAAILSVAQYLYSEGIPFGFGVIPLYTDPLGIYNNGVPKTIALTDAPSFVSAIEYLLTHGGTMIDHGYTHQYGNARNPFNGVSGADTEFFLATVAPSNSVVWSGPVPGDSAAWTQGRVASAVAAFKAAGLPVPTLWETPHYFATDVDYRTIAKTYPVRYERSVYFRGGLSGGPVDYGSYLPQFFPYVVTDVYGTTVLPENLGNYVPAEYNNNPPRLPADIIHEAQLNLAVRDGFASFFYHPYYGTVPLQQIVSGIKALGYTFVAPSASLR